MMTSAPDRAPRQPNRSGRQVWRPAVRGATLLEVMVAFVIAGLILSGVGSVMTHRSDADLVMELVERAKSSIGRAQAEAIRSGHPQEVELGFRRPVRREGVHHVVVPEGVRASLVGARTASDADQPPRVAIVFFEDGTNTGGTITLGRGVFDARIQINWMTGDVGR